jgi:hypothetical protein
MKNLKKLDDIIPNKDKFFDKTLNKLSRMNIEKSEELYPSTPGLIRQGLSFLPRLGAKALIKTESPNAKILSRMLNGSSFTGSRYFYNQGGE